MQVLQLFHHALEISQDTCEGVMVIRQLVIYLDKSGIHSRFPGLGMLSQEIVSHDLLMDGRYCEGGRRHAIRVAV